MIRFGPQETDKVCRVTVIDDSLYEAEESFKVVLADVLGGQIGVRNETVIFIEADATDGNFFFFLNFKLRLLNLFETGVPCSVGI